MRMLRLAELHRLRTPASEFGRRRGRGTDRRGRYPRRDGLGPARPRRVAPFGFLDDAFEVVTGSGTPSERGRRSVLMRARDLVKQRARLGRVDAAHQHVALTGANAAPDRGRRRRIEGARDRCRCRGGPERRPAAASRAAACLRFVFVRGASQQIAERPAFAALRAAGARLAAAR